MTRNAPKVSRISTLLFGLGLTDTPFEQEKKDKLYIQRRRSTGETTLVRRPSSKNLSNDTKSAPTTKDKNKNQRRKSDANDNAVPGTWSAAKGPIAADDSFDDKPVFTALQDKTLLRMKLIESKSWKEIATEVGKEVWDVKVRFKEIKPTDEANWKMANGYGDSAANTGGGKNNAKGGGNELKKNKKQGQGQTQNQKNSWQKQQQSQQHNVNDADEAGDGRAEDPAGGGVVELEEDDHYSQVELVLLCRLLHRDQKNLWARIASQFFDKTGRRIHPLDIKEKMTGVAAADRDS